MKWLAILVILMLTSTIWSWCTQPGPCVCKLRDPCTCRECPTGYLCNTDNGNCYLIDKPNHIPCQDDSDCKNGDFCDRGVCW